MAQELIVLVNTAGQPIGTAEKLPAHHAETPLHLAFSCYVFNDRGQLLVTQRAKSKKVWPGIWSNSLCGHPAPGEAMVAAIHRRLDEELGMSAKDFKILLPNYIYTTPPFNGVIEHEFCPVYIARAIHQPLANPAEVEAWRWQNWEDYVKELKADSADKYSYWAKDQLKQLQNHPLIKQYSKPQ